MDRVLIIKHGALGDFVMTIGLIQAIHQQHPKAHFTLLTGAPYVAIGKQMGMFDDYIIDNRKGLETLTVLKRILDGHYTHIYDLQSRTRTITYRKLLRPLLPAGEIRWYVINDKPKNTPSRNISICYTISKKSPLHPGTVTKTPWDIKSLPYDISFLKGKGEHFDLLPEHFVLFIPGCSAKNAYKRWPAANYIEIARRLAEKNIKTVVVGTRAEETEITAICQADPANIINMMGKTEILDMPQIALRAKCTIGNDTGPSHMASLSGAPTIGIYDQRTGHAKLRGRCAQSIVSTGTIDLITPDQVWQAMQPYISQT